VTDDRFGKLSWHAAKATLPEDGWTHEASDFSVWLSENLDVLGSELGLALELVKREHAVGKYWLDLLLRDGDNRAVIVENQFGHTDHDHLGKVLTYCAGTGAQVVVWISERMTEEHRAALDWLNENTVSGVAFFGVEVALARIDGSRPAPFFRVVSRPNEWSKSQQPSGSPADWSFAAYESALNVSSGRIAIAKALVEQLEAHIAEEGLPWQPVFRKGYVAFKRPGDYNVFVVDVYWNAPPRVAVKIPAAPTALNLQDPLPSLPSKWLAAESEWGWTVSKPDEVPDLAALVSIARRFHPDGPSPMAVVEPGGA
jgi:hypothetical protein